jgi:cytochrome c biogenesis protein CcmG/thiol:disulfide interchange protein DsbE
LILQCLKGRFSMSSVRSIRFLPGLWACFALANALLLTPAHALDKGQNAPEIDLVDFSGQPVKLSALRGKVVLVDFWASWCVPCRESLPALEKLSKSYRDRGLVVVGVNIDKAPEEARAFLTKNKFSLSFPLVNDKDHKVAERYAPPTMPSSYLIDREGKVQRVHAGFRPSDAEKLESEIKTLLN